MNIENEKNIWGYSTRTHKKIMGILGQKCPNHTINDYQALIKEMVDKMNLKQYTHVLSMEEIDKLWEKTMEEYL